MKYRMAENERLI